MFSLNPGSAWGYYTGLGLGFVLGLPLCALSLPLSWASYEAEPDRMFFVQSVLSPSFTLGALAGTALALPGYPFGLPFAPDRPPPPPEPE